MEQKLILIVDDDEAVNSSLASLLASEAMVIRIASTVEEAERLLMTEVFDLAIVDLSLTGRVGREGLDLISRIKRRTPETQVVLLTGYGSPEIEREARQRGAVEYWEKTIPITTLIERLRALGLPVRQEGSSNGCAAFNGG
ncbi:MAG: response regulator [Acidobacteria bacterium]|nr:MAG: response regulator [Acidobacteriota bacterium]